MGFLILDSRLSFFSGFSGCQRQSHTHTCAVLPCSLSSFKLLLKSLLNKEKYYFKLFKHVLSAPAVEALY